MHTRWHTRTIQKHLWAAKGSSGFQRVYEKSWRQLIFPDVFLLFAYWVLPQPAPIVRALRLNVNTIITAGDAPVGVSRPGRLACPARLAASRHISAPRSAPAALLRSVLFNSCHYVPAKWNPLFPPFLSISIFLGSPFYPAPTTHSDCNGWNRESSLLLLSCLSVAIVYSQNLDSGPSDSLGGKWTLWHFTRWKVAAHGITCKHCSLLPWQRRTKIQPSSTCLPQTLTHKRDFPAPSCWARWKPSSCVLFCFLLACLPLLLTMWWSALYCCHVSTGLIVFFSLGTLMLRELRRSEDGEMNC